MKPITNIGQAKVFSPGTTGLFNTSNERVVNMVATKHEVIVLIQDKTVTTRIVAINPHTYKTTTLFTETRGRTTETGVQCGTLAYHITPKGEERLIAQIQSTGSSTQGILSINLITLARDPITGELVNTNKGYSRSIDFRSVWNIKACFDIFCTEDGYLWSNAININRGCTLIRSSYEYNSTNLIGYLLDNSTTETYLTMWASEKHYYKILQTSSDLIISKHYTNTDSPLVGTITIAKSDVMKNTSSPIHGMTVNGVCYLLTNLGLYKFDDYLFITSSGQKISPIKMSEVDTTDGAKWVSDVASTQILTRYNDYLIYPQDELVYNLVSMVDNTTHRYNWGTNFIDKLVVTDSFLCGMTQPTGAFVIHSLDSRYKQGIEIGVNEKLTLHKCLAKLQDLHLATQKHYNRLYTILSESTDIPPNSTMDALLDLVEHRIHIPAYTAGTKEILYTPNKTITLNTVNTEVLAGTYICTFTGEINVKVGFTSDSICSVNKFTIIVRHIRKSGIKYMDHTYAGPTSSGSKLISVRDIEYGDTLQVLGKLTYKCSNHTPTITFINITGDRLY